MEEDQSEQLDSNASHAFPLFLNLMERLVLVVGGGRVGSRKAAAAQAAGATVKVIDPATSPLAIADLSAKVILISEPYRSYHLDGACLVFAAATPEVNTRVVADARARGVWVNSANEPEAGDFIMPSVIR
jgi:precorrin-2 dehydrogenase/sirohydrochlorin ferrochelatase